MLKAYKYRIYPTEDQKKHLYFSMGACRFVYNLALETKTAAWVSAKKNLTAYELMKQVTELKHSGIADWLKDVNSLSLEASITNLDSAYKRFFKGGGFPKFKKRRNGGSIHYRQSIYAQNGKIKVPKAGWIACIEHRPFPDAELRSITISRTPTDKYFASLLYKDQTDTPIKALKSEDTAVGVDVGIKMFATLSDGTEVENPKFLHKQLARLKKEQRTLARRYKKGIPVKEQSKGWHKQRLVVATLQERIANQRQDFLHKLSDSITKSYDTICVEDLNIKGMMQNHKLAKAISDVSWSEFMTQLEYKCEWRGKNLIKIGRFDPSSKICSTCGTINKELKLSDREWDCGKCETRHQRDINAAKNIKTFGFKANPSTVNVVQ